MTDATTTTTTESGTSNPTTVTRELNGIADEIVKLGSTWARYGLGVGQSALRTSAETFETTAKMLARLSDTLQQK